MGRRSVRTVTPVPLHTVISESVWRALQERSRTSGQSIAHIVEMVLAEALDTQHDAMFQVSTSGAIVQGLYQGCVSIAELRRYGDLGIGTFEDLDGEMILIDGRCFQARSDGSVVEAPDESLTPFACVVHFAPDSIEDVADVTSCADLTARIDALRTSRNGMVSLRITGLFSRMLVRAACRTQSGTDLVEATSRQSLFDFAEVPGTIVGFWSPEYAESIAIAGYHMHFISDDRTMGGHVLELSAPSLRVEINEVNDVRLSIPETHAFLEADLNRDNSAALDVAQRQVRGR